MNKNQIREFIHALKNPLTAIMTNLELLLGGYVSNIDEETKKILNEILFNAKYLDIILKNTSDMVKIKDKNEIISQKIDISKIVSDVKKELEILFENKEQIKLKIKSKAEIIANEDMIRRFFIIILYELLKFTGETSNLELEIFSSKELKTGKEIAGINLFFVGNDDNIKSENIFKELFITPKSKSMKLINQFIKKILSFYNGRIGIKKNSHTYLQILFSKEEA